MTNIDQSIGPGFLGFLVLFALALACWFLFRSMTKHVRKVKRDEAALAAVDREAGGDVVAGEAHDG